MDKSKTKEAKVPLEEFLEVVADYNLKVQLAGAEAYANLDLLYMDIRATWYLDGGSAAWRKHQKEMEALPQ